MKKIILLILLSFMSLTGFAQILTEDFETAPVNPDGSGVWALSSGNWLVRDNRENGAPNWQRNAQLSFPAHNGTGAAYVNRENAGDGVLTEEWLISPQVTITANAQLRFFTRQTLVGAPDPGTIYEVRVSSSADQNDMSAFTTVLASYTEATLSTLTADQLDYEEKLINLGFTGPRYFAFVKVFQQSGDALAGDRWLIDDINIVTQCIDPIAPLSATNISATGATLGWTMPTGNTQNQFEIEYGVSGFTQGTGTVITGITSSTSPRTTVIPPGTLTPSTCYQFYVRSICANATSLWVGPFNFCTIPLGSVCTAPIVASPAPFSDTSNTTIYGNNITNATPGSSCGAGNGFLGGNDVVYQYTVPATTTGLLSITMIPLNGATNTGVFVYNSCATIGASCIAGVGNATSNIRLIPSLNVTAGQVIYIVVSSTTATPTFGYTLLIQDVNCVAPTNLGLIGTPTVHDATLKWDAGTGSVSNSWQVVVQTAGSPIPSGSGITVTAPNNTTGILASTALLPTPGPLLQDTTYEFWVRGDCGNGTFSTWSGPFSFTTPPTCPKPTFVNNATVTTFNSITVSYTNNSTATEFEVYHVPCGDPAPNAASDGENTPLTVNFVIANLNPDTCYDVYVRAICGPGDLSQWTGPLTATTQIIPPACGGVYTDSGGANGNYGNDEDFTVTICPTVQGEKVTVTFATFNTEATWDGIYVFDGNSINAPQIASTNPAGNAGGPLTTPGAFWGTTVPGPFTSTSADGCLTFRFLSDDSGVRAGWTANVTCAPPPPCPKPTGVALGAVTATTAVINFGNPGNAVSYGVIALPCGSAAPTAGSPWITSNVAPPSYTFTGLLPDTCYDFYVMANCGQDGMSEPAGPRTATTQIAPPECGGTYSDPGGSAANYPNNSNVTITICPTIPGDKVTVTFTTFNTEANWDGIYVYNGNSTGAPQIASTNPAGNAAGPLTTPGAFWGTTIPGPFTSTSADGCLTFNFRSDGSFNNPGWTALVTCAPPPTCAIPQNLAIPALTVTHNSVVFNWTQPQSPDGSTATAWQVLPLPCGSPAPTANSTGWTAVSQLSNIINNLTPETCYDFYVRAVCSETDSSPWAGPITVTTKVAPPVCGGLFTDLGGVNANYPNNSDQIVTICPNPGELVTVTFTAFNTEANWDGLYVFDGPTINAPQISSGNPTGNGPLNTLAGAFWGTTIPGPFTSTSADGCLTFRFRSDGSFNNPGFVANVTCAPIPTCVKPNPIIAGTISQNSGTFTWSQPANPDGSVASAWEVIVLPFGSPAPDANTNGIPTSTASFNASGLQAGVRYTIYVRAICSANDSSEWGSLNFATLPVNDECINAIFAVVNQNLNCVQTTPGTVIGATASLPAPSCAGANDDVWFTFTATDASHIVSFNNTSPANADLDFAVYEGSACGGLTQHGACNIADNLTPGTTYYIRVFTPGTVTQNINFNLCIGTLPCTEAPAFCTGQTVTYQNATNVPSLGQIGCLFTSPNPAFFFLQVNQAGPLNYLISQVDVNGTPRDVDYVTWGPFTDLEIACNAVPANPLPGVLPAPTPAQGCPGTIHACSYSAAPTEIVCIPDAQLCEVYVIMITNFSNQPGFVTFTQTNNNGGTTECFPINTFNYPETRYCQNGVDPAPVLDPGAQHGTYTSTPGLVIDPITGVIDLSASTPGAYIVTSTTLTSTEGACDNIPSITTSRTVIITAPADATITYDAATYCSSITTPQNVTLTGTINGSYSATPTGLNVNPGTGAILPIASQPGVYTVSYTVAAQGGCPEFVTTTQVEIIATPLIPFINNVVTCESTYTLPALTIGNYYTQAGGPNGPGTMLNAGDVISEDTTIYVYSITGTCTDEKSFTITLGDLEVPPVSDVSECVSYTLPELPAGFGYYAATGGQTPLSGTLNTSQTIYVYAQVGECTAETSFNLTIGSVDAGEPENITSCTPVTLTTLPANLTYYTAAGGPTGTGSIITDLTITETQTIYIWAQSGTCTDEAQFIVTINSSLTPEFTAIPNPCVGAPAIILPLISDNLITGTWDIPVVQTATAGTTVYTFTPSAILFPCAVQTTLSVTVDAPIVPTFDPIPAVCVGGSAQGLPTASTNTTPITGTWSPAVIDTSVAGTTCYTFTPDPAFTCATTAQLCVTVTGSILPTFTQVAPICQNTVAAVLPTTSNNLVNGTWTNLGVIDTSVAGVFTYTFTPDPANTCALPETMLITILPEITPTFNPIPDVCLNGVAPILPLTSTNSTPITGTWSGTVNTTVAGSQTFTFTPDGVIPCALSTTTITVNVITPQVPNFAPITLCFGQTAPLLDPTSPNGIPGIWSPTTIDNTQTLSYTFTPSVTCASSQTITVTVTPLVTPDFAAIPTFCAGANVPSLDPTSPNGVTGTWSPATVSSTVSGCYVFTPNAGQCANTQTICTTVIQPTTPDFAAIPAICSGGSAPTLLNVSPNGVNGTWSPATINNTQSGCYTFTPNAGECANTQQLCVTINDTPDFNLFGQCEGADYVIRIQSPNYNPDDATYSWQLNDQAIPGSNAFLVATGVGTYKAIVTVNGCPGEAEWMVGGIACEIQKGISPKGTGPGDNKNDFFDLASMNVKKLEIFNRYGKIVYSQENYTNQWYGQTDKGDELPDGTYFYAIEMKGGAEPKTGWIYINREQ